MATFVQKLGSILRTKLAVKWGLPPKLDPGWEGHVHKAAHDFHFEPLEVRERDGRPFCRLRNVGPTHSIGPRVRDLALAVSDALEIPAARRSQTVLEVSSPRSALTSFITILLLLIPAAAVGFGIWKLVLWWSETRSVERSAIVLGPIAFVALAILAASLSGGEDVIRKPFEKAFDPGRRARIRAAEQRAIAGLPPEDFESALEVTEGHILEAEAKFKALEGLDYRTRSIRDDRDQLWVRARQAFLIACFFLFFSLAGPGTAVWLLVRSQDWHYLLASVSLSAVPLAIGLALLRHDNKLRDQHRDAETELAALDRLQLALDYAAVDSEETQLETRRKVIQQLIQPPVPIPLKRRRKKKGAEDAEDIGVGTVLDKATEAVKSVIGKGE